MGHLVSTVLRSAEVLLAMASDDDMRVGCERTSGDVGHEIDR